MSSGLTGQAGQTGEQLHYRLVPDLTVCLFYATIRRNLGGQRSACWAI